MIIIESHRKNTDLLQRQYPKAIIADVTSHAKEGLI